MSPPSDNPCGDIMHSDTLKDHLERHFFAHDYTLHDDAVIEITHQVATLSADECASIIAQLLTYLGACVEWLEVMVRLKSHIISVYIGWRDALKLRSG